MRRHPRIGQAALRGPRERGPNGPAIPDATALAETDVLGAFPPACLDGPGSRFPGCCTLC